MFPTIFNEFRLNVTVLTIKQQTFTPNPQPVRQPMRDTTTYEERGLDQSGLTKKKQQQ